MIWPGPGEYECFLTAYDAQVIAVRLSALHWCLCFTLHYSLAGLRTVYGEWVSGWCCDGCLVYSGRLLHLAFHGAAVHTGD